MLGQIIFATSKMDRTRPLGKTVKDTLFAELKVGSPHPRGPAPLACARGHSRLQASTGREGFGGPSDADERCPGVVDFFGGNTAGRRDAEFHRVQNGPKNDRKIHF